MNIQKVDSFGGNPLEDAANSILEKDACYCLAHGDGIFLTEAVQQQIRANWHDFVKYGVMDEDAFVGQCLLCGESFQTGDIIIKEQDGSSNAIHLGCSSNKFKLHRKNLYKLCKCTGR